MSIPKGSAVVFILIMVLTGCAASGDQWILSRGSGRTLELAWWNALSGAMLRGREDDLQPGRIVRAHEFMARSAERSWKDFGKGSEIVGQPWAAERMVHADFLFQVDQAGFEKAVEDAIRRIARGKPAEPDAELLLLEQTLLGFPRSYISSEVISSSYDAASGVHITEVRVTLDVDRTNALLASLEKFFATRNLYESMELVYQMRFDHHPWRSKGEVRAMGKKREYDFIGITENDKTYVKYDRDKFFEQMGRSGLVLTVIEPDFKKRRLSETSHFIAKEHAELVGRATRFDNQNITSTGASNTRLWRSYVSLLDENGNVVATRDNAMPSPQWVVGKNVMFMPILTRKDENQYLDANRSGYLNPGRAEFIETWRIHLSPEEAARVAEVKAGIHYPDDRRNNY